MTETDGWDRRLPERLFATDRYPKARLNVYSKPDILCSIREALKGTKQLKKLLGSCFGSLFALPVSQSLLSNQLIHALICRQVLSKKKYEMWTIFGGHPLRFSLVEFASVTGLPCHDFPDDYDPELETLGTCSESTYWETLIGDDMTATLADVKEKMFETKDKTRKLRLALLLIVDGILIAKRQTAQPTPKFVDMLADIDAFLAFPWGRESFLKTIGSLRPRIRVRGKPVDPVGLFIKQLQQKTIRLVGFPLSLQLLAFKNIPTLMEALTDANDTRNFLEWPSLDIPKQWTSLSDVHAVEQKEDLIVDPIIEASLGEDGFGDWDDEKKKDKKLEFMKGLITEGYQFRKEEWPEGDNSLRKIAVVNKKKGTARKRRVLSGKDKGVASSDLFPNQSGSKHKRRKVEDNIPIIDSPIPHDLVDRFVTMEKAIADLKRDNSKLLKFYRWKRAKNNNIRKGLRLTKIHGRVRVKPPKKPSSPINISPKHTISTSVDLLGDGENIEWDKFQYGVNPHAIDNEEVADQFEAEVSIRGGTKKTEEESRVDMEEGKTTSEDAEQLKGTTEVEENVPMDTDKKQVEAGSDETAEVEEDVETRGTTEVEENVPMDTDKKQVEAGSDETAEVEEDVETRGTTEVEEETYKQQDADHLHTDMDMDTAGTTKVEEVVTMDTDKKQEEVEVLQTEMNVQRIGITAEEEEGDKDRDENQVEARSGEGTKGEAASRETTAQREERKDEGEDVQTEVDDNNMTSTKEGEAEKSINLSDVNEVGKARENTEEENIADVEAGSDETAEVEEDVETRETTEVEEETYKQQGETITSGEHTQDSAEGKPIATGGQIQELVEDQIPTDGAQEQGGDSDVSERWSILSVIEKKLVEALLQSHRKVVIDSKPDAREQEYRTFHSTLKSAPKTEHITTCGHTINNSFLLDLAQSRKLVSTQHMEVLVSLLRKRHKVTLSQERSALVAPWFGNYLQGKYIEFEAATDKSRIQWGDQLKRFISTEWFRDIDRLYLPMIWNDNHWVGVAINLGTWNVEIVDPNTSMYDLKEVQRFIAPIVEMVPYIIQIFCQPSMSHSNELKPFGWNRIGGIYVNKGTGDCGPVAMKLLEIHVTGGGPKQMAQITDEIVDQFRGEYALDIYAELVAPAYAICL